MSNASYIELQHLVSDTQTPERQSAKPRVQVNDGAPRTLEQQSPSRLWRIGVPGALLAIPLAYVVLISCVVSLHGQNKSTFGKNVQEVLEVASTLWPISFAAVAGPFLKTLALYNAEKGSTLATLEFLSTSQTTVSAFVNLALYGCTQAWAVAVVFVWCLSPLGGQAAVRSINLHSSLNTTHIPAIHYLGGNISDMQPDHRHQMGHMGDMWIFDSGPASEEFIFNLRNNFGSVFSTPDVSVSHSNGSSDSFEDTVHNIGSAWQAARLGRRDIWRNVRVPFLELLPQYDSTLPYGWIHVPADMVVPYSSFIGMPIRGGSTPRAGNSSIQVQSHYMTLSCGPDFNGSSWLKPDAYKLAHHDLSNDFPLQYQYQGAFPIRTYPNIFLDFVNDTETNWEHNMITYFSLNGTEPSKKLQLVIGGSCTGDYHRDVFLRTCDVSTTYVEVEVNCTRTTTFDDQNCQATRVRHTPGFPLSGNLTAISNSFISRGVVWEFPFAASEYDIAAPGVIEMYLKDPPRTFARSHLINPFPGCFSNVSRSAFEVRLATSLNTFVAATLNSTVLTGADGTSLKNRNYSWKNATATWTEFTDEIYLLDKLWFPMWLISTIVLLIMAIANVIFRAMITAPDFLNGVAGLTRDSPYVKVPQDHSGESGSDRLRRLKGTRVRICDVQSEEEVGKIVLTTELNSLKLAWERVYK